jgi:hypothetical protein
MNRKRQNQRILAIAPSTRGVGFAVLEGEKLVDWGVKSARKEKNAASLVKVDDLITHYRPTRLVLEDSSPESSRRSPRIRALSTRIIALAAKRSVKVKVLGRKIMKKAYFADGKGTKHEIAELLAQRFPQELGTRLPPKRKPWNSEHHQMGVFDAVAIAIAFQTK